MKIRLATRADMPALVEMGAKFIASTPYGLLFHTDPESLGRLGDILFAFGEHAAILVCEDDAGVFGMLAVVAAPHPISGQLYADEVVWWVDPTRRGALKAGPSLLRFAEDWARERGCYMIKMVAPFAASTVARFYERMGYTPIETAHAKVL